MSEYSGPERRTRVDNTEVYSMLARIDERTSIMAESMKSLATCERVDAVEKKLDEHLANHDKKGAKIAEWVGIAAASIIGAVGLVKGIK